MELGSAEPGLLWAINQARTCMKELLETLNNSKEAIKSNHFGIYARGVEKLEQERRAAKKRRPHQVSKVQD